MPFETGFYFDFADVGLTTVATFLYLKDRDGNVISFPANCKMKADIEVIEAFNSGVSDVITLGDAAAVDTFLAAGDVNEGVIGEYPAKTVVKRGKPTAAYAVRIVWVATYAGGGAPTTGKCRVNLSFLLEEAD